ncbi:hypothetical protein [Enterobacter sp. Bisph1]|uniref:hypothetical protein n=1 Tax=Enterobacter sp. Bisph1 TaxID=1274399 RepID=UPI0006924ACB|nr:hypothetical protein [Enterobacter sp. Bisph1]
MDKEAVKKALHDLQVPPDSYAIDEVKDETLCLLFDGALWCVFYSERGNRSEPEYFTYEQDACEGFLARIRNGFSCINFFNFQK